MKKLLCTIVLFACACGLAGEAQAGQTVVGFSNRTSSGNFFAALNRAVKEVGEAAGYKMIVTDAQTDFTKQIGDVEDMLTQGIDFLILNPQDPKAGLQMVQKANEAGVPVIALDSLLDESAQVLTRVASGNYDGSYLTGEYAAQVAGNTPIRLALISFMQGNIGCWERRTGFMSGFVEKQLADKGTAKLDVVMQTWAVGTDEGGLKCMEDTLTARPDVNMVFSETSLQLKGVLNAIRAAGRQDDIMLFSFDGTQFEFDAIKNGQLYATAENSPLQLARITFDVIKRYENGERVFPSNMAPKAIMVNKDNVDAVYEDGF